MQIHETPQEDVLVVTIQAQLDTVSAPQFEARLLALIDGGERRICIDCEPLSYVNSAGLKAFLVGAKQLDVVGGKLILCALSSSVRMVFEMIGFSQIMTLVETREDAIIRLSGQAAVT